MMKCVFLALVFFITHFKSVSAGDVQGPIHSLEGTGKLVLTFDDGPSELTPSFLDMLSKYNVKATFFIMGNKINSDSRHIIARMLREGHIVANHNWNHDRPHELGEELWKTNYEKSARNLIQIYKDLGYSPRHYYFRAPFGMYPEDWVTEVNAKIFDNPRCIQHVGWSVKSADWRATQFSEDIYRRVLWQITDPKLFPFDYEPKYSMPRWNGGVILMHDGLSLEELKKPAPGLRPLSMVVETLKAVEKLLKVRQFYQFDILELNKVEEFKAPLEPCVIKK